MIMKGRKGKARRGKGKVPCDCPKCCPGKYQFIPVSGTVGAEWAVELARVVSSRSKRVIIAGAPWEDYKIARVKLALDFGKKGLGFAFRALVEGWDGYRLNRDMY
jgi:hypothetical protein